MKSHTTGPTARSFLSPPRRWRRIGIPLVLTCSAAAALALHGCEQTRPTAVQETAPAPRAAKQSSNTGMGRWDPPFTWGGASPIVGIHLHLLPSGKVLTWGHAGLPLVWDPVTRQFTTVPSPSLEFCSGHAFLPDGRLLVTGGHDDTRGDQFGVRNVNAFDFATQTWTVQSPLAYGRWYPSSTTLPNGDILTTGGDDSTRMQMPYPEIWSHGTSRVLTGARWDFIDTSSAYYPRMFVAPNGKLFYAGEEQQSRWLDVTGGGSWTAGPLGNFGRRDYGSAVMYAPGKVLIVGGGYTPTATAEAIDLTTGSPGWRYVSSMANARRQLNVTLLADGTVLATGGTSAYGFSNESGAVLAAERWNPATGAWTTLASARVIRVYHSTAILLPNARVLSAGSGEGGGATDQHTAEIFSPPYLFDATGNAVQRPSISSAPSAIAYGQSFAVGAPKAASIGAVNLVRLSSVTHTFNESQLFVPLGFTRASERSLQVTAPSSGTVAPPGYYMLFVLDRTGVPSVARIVRVG